MHVILVLGSGTKKEYPSPVLKSRLDRAIDFYVNLPNPEEFLIIVAGGYGKKNYSEAEVMSKYLIDRKIPEGKIIEENRSVSTVENFIFSKSLLENLGVKVDSVVVFTSEFHLKRALLIAKNYFSNVTGIGSVSEGDYQYFEKEAKSLSRYPE